MKKNLITSITKICVVFFLFLAFTQCSDEERMTILPEGNPPVASDSTATDSTAIEDPSTEPSVVESNMSCSSCTYVVPDDVSLIDGEKLGIKPGDVICFNGALSYTRNLTFERIVGTPENPVIVTNCDRPATINTPGKPYAIRFNNSKFFRVSGGSTDGSYGIKITGSASNGLVLGYLATNFEVDHLEVYDVGFAGIMAKTDPGCNPESVRGNFTMRDVSFHHNYIHDTHGEGFYIGHSSYGGKETSCGFLLPHTIENVKVYKNIVKNSGWDGIQVSSAPIGAEIYDNVVENFSTANKPAQSSGICIGGGTAGLCYNNFIKDGNGSGISVFGHADNTIYNNVIINAGKGMFIDERTEPGAGYRVLHNTIINPREQGLLIYAEKVPVNMVVNNIIINPGSYDTAGERAYVGTLGSSVKLDMSNNYLTRNIAELKFVNAATFDVRLTSNSPVIDKGRDVSSYIYAKDFYSAVRLRGSAYDIGASEF